MPAFAFRQSFVNLCCDSFENPFCAAVVILKHSCYTAQYNFIRELSTSRLFIEETFVPKDRARTAQPFDFLFNFGFQICECL